jgi:hypothetical protein
MGQREPKRYERSGTHLHLSNGYEKIIIIIIIKTNNSTFSLYPSFEASQTWD